MWGATHNTLKSDRYHPTFQSTRPVWGATIALRFYCNNKQYFNPRAPCGARPVFVDAIRGTDVISIHAPRVGRDSRAFSAVFAAVIFQSTRPVWGATACPHNGHAALHISIHAPRVGRDVKTCELLLSVRRFQSTRPVWGATFFEQCGCWYVDISIHAPRVGRDASTSATSCCTRRFQSTRPVWGATRAGRAARRGYRDFNPRAPCGARPHRQSCGGRHRHFNPRAPCGARRPSSRRRSESRYFNPRAPCGARLMDFDGKDGVMQFQSTRPVWGATFFRHHATPSTVFQSTRPVWGATANLTILPRQICTKGTKEFLLGRKTHGKKEK